MEFLFWDAHRILLIDYFEKDQAMSSDRYKVQLVCLKKEIVKNTTIWERKSAFSPRQSFVSQAEIKNYISALIVFLSFDF